MTQENYSSGFFLSLCLHVAIVAVFTVKALIFPAESLIFEDAIRVDLVGLPDKVEKAPPAKEESKPNAETKPPEPVKLPVPPPKAVPQIDAKAVQNSALNKLKTLAALEKLKSAPQKQETAQPKQEPAAPAKEIQYKGNILSAGTALTGLSKLQHNQYLGEIKKHVHKNWFLPEWLTNKGLNAQITVKIDEDGNVLEKTIVKSSDNPSFDDLVVATITKSNPFPAPPEKFVDILRVNGLTLGFPE